MAAMTTPEPNYYQILGVSSQVDPESLRKAFHHLTKLHHPDKNPTNLEKFKDISRAYRVLSDPQKRREYDMRVLRNIQQRQMRDFMTRSSTMPTSVSSEQRSTSGKYQSATSAAGSSSHHRQQQQHRQNVPYASSHTNRRQHHFLDDGDDGGGGQVHCSSSSSPARTAATLGGGCMGGTSQPQVTRTYHYGAPAPSLSSWDPSRVQIVRCAVCHGTGIVVRYERLGLGLMKEVKVLCAACSGRGTWCKLFSLQT